MTPLIGVLCARAGASAAKSCAAAASRRHGAFIRADCPCVSTTPRGNLRCSEVTSLWCFFYDISHGDVAEAASVNRAWRAGIGGSGMARIPPSWQVRLRVSAAERGPPGSDAAPGRVRSARVESPAGAINTGRNPPEGPPPTLLILTLYGSIILICNDWIRLM